MPGRMLSIQILFTKQILSQGICLLFHSNSYHYGSSKSVCQCFAVNEIEEKKRDLGTTPYSKQVVSGRYRKRVRVTNAQKPSDLSEIL